MFRFAWLLVLLLVACNNPIPKSSVPKPMGLLKVTITGIGEGASPDAIAQWAHGASSGPEVKGQASIVVSVGGTNALGDVQLTRRAVSFYDDDSTNTRYVLATFDLINRTTTFFPNFTLYAVNMPSNLGGTGVVAMTAGTGAAITDPAVARSLKPAHGMRSSLSSVRVNEDIADLQLFTPSEATNIKTQAVSLNILPSTATVLEYGFVARNFSGGRTITPPNSSTLSDCTTAACKGTVTLAYKFPKISPRQNNPFSFSLYFVVANETVQVGSQSMEEHAPNTAMGLDAPAAAFSQVRTVAGSSFGMSEERLNPLCRVKTAISPDAFLGQDPLPAAAGSLDVCFGASGKRSSPLVSSQPIWGMAVQPDGKIVAVGSGFVGGLRNFAIVRYNPNGSVDTNFGTEGKVLVGYNSTSSENAYAIAIQGDGKIVVGGTSYVDSVTSNDFLLVRLNPDGSLDSGFGTGGMVYTVISSGSDYILDLALQTDGKIVAVGGTMGSTNQDLAVVRYTASGLPDTSFDSDGIVITPIGFYNEGRAVAIQADGKIVVAGESDLGPDNDFTVSRYNPNGSLDPTFNGNGVAITPVGFYANLHTDDNLRGMALQADGKIVVVGITDTDPTPSGRSNDVSLVRYNQSGSLDTTFDGDGKVTVPIGPGDDYAGNLGVQADGKLVVGGFTGTFPLTDFAALRFNSNGSLDSGFGTGGKAITDFASTVDGAYTMALQPDGKIVLGGESNLHFGLARYNP